MLVVNRAADFAVVVCSVLCLISRWQDISFGRRWLHVGSLGKQCVYYSIVRRTAQTILQCRAGIGVRGRATAGIVWSGVSE